VSLSRRARECWEFDKDAFTATRPLASLSNYWRKRRSARVPAQPLSAWHVGGRAIRSKKWRSRKPSFTNAEIGSRAEVEANTSADGQPLTREF
jgi:hypothetical protein